MRPIHTMIIFGVAALPMAMFIAALLWAVSAPWVLQLGVILFAVLDGMFTGCMCWAVKTEEGG